MSTIDWILVVVPIALVLVVSVYTHKYVKSVADFLSAGRCAGRYLLANARGESDAGLANTMSRFEVILVSGFVLGFWEKIQVPIILLVGISGFVIYRFRETRALTLAQFLEMRYSRAFRLFMGMLAFVSGILNYGVFPAISARFFIYFLDLPTEVQFGSTVVSTLSLIMAGYLTCTVFMILVGGQVTLMVADCLEGIFSHLVYIIIAIAVFYVVSWTQVVQVMEMGPPGNSLIDPFDAGEVRDFNFMYVLMALAIRIYTTMAMQNKQGFNSAARSPHESRMGGVLGEWRGYARMLMLLMLAICALTYLNHPAFAQEAAPIHSTIDSVGDPYLQKQMTVPIALRYLLPIGIKGLFVAIMIMGLLAGDAGHMHSWGSIFIQDVIVPLRKKAMSPKQHIWALRLAVIFVAVFAFLFSLMFRQNQYIRLWWDVTAGIFTGGAGAAIIGGLYWRRGTAGGAWSAAIVGSIFAFVGIICSSGYWGSFVVPKFGDAFAAMGMSLPSKFWLNGQETAFSAAILATVTYVVVSLLTCRQPFDLDRMLHRGRYAVESEHKAPTLGWRDRLRLRNILRFDKNFTFNDKLVAAGIFWWSMFLVGVNVVVTAWNLAFQRWSIAQWERYWMILGIAVPLLISVATLFWFGIGGVKDIFAFFHDLRTMKRDDGDDGRVVVPEPGHAFEVLRSAESDSRRAVSSTPMAAGNEVRVR